MNPTATFIMQNALMHTGVRSPECSLSTSLYMVASRTESLFLAVEHELLTAALDPAYVAPCHPALEFPLSIGSAHVATMKPPTPPDPNLLESFNVRCGLNEVAPLAVGVARVIEPLLRSYRARLPPAQWRAICIRTMHVLKSSLDPLKGNLPKTTTAAEQHQKVSERFLMVNTFHVFHGGVKSGANGMHRNTADISSGMQWRDLDTALGVLQQQALCTIHSVLAEPFSQVRVSVLCSPFACRYGASAGHHMDVHVSHLSCFRAGG